MKRLLFLIIFVIPVSVFYGQSSYYVKDNLMHVGVKLINGGAIKNAKQCEIEVKKQIFVYSPDEVEAYGFKNGSSYFSRVIKFNNEEKKVFLERLSQGGINFYYYKDKKGKKFFLGKDSGPLVEILKKDNDNRNYKDFLKSYTEDCNTVSEVLKLVTYRKSSLAKFMDQYNSCIEKPFPFIRYGLTIGYTVTKLVNPKTSVKELKNAVFKNDNSFNVGIFSDIPVFSNYLSLRPEIYLQKSAFSSHSVVNNIVNDVVINTTSVNIPVLIRYAYPSKKYRPYINVGGIFAYNIENNNAIYITTISNDIVEIEKTNSSNIYSEKQIGYAIGGGIQINIDYRKSLFLDLRYYGLYGLEDETFGTRSFQCIIGFNF